MLVLTRKPKEEIVIDGCIRLTVVHVQGQTVRIGIEAPPEVPIHRREVAERLEREAVAHGCWTI